MSKKYKIGIPGWKTGDNSFGVSVTYIDYISQFGEPIILAPESEIRTDLDLLILSGGPDVDPARYGEKPGYYTGKACLHREYFDINHLPHYINMSTPIYGICRGLQSIAVHFNFKLIQHIKGHPSNNEYSRSALTHDVTILNPYYDIINRNLRGLKRTFKVNSMHHQAINRSTLNGPLKVIGQSNDGIIELLAHTELPIVAEQFHSEEIDIDFSLKTIEFLLENKRSLLK